MSTVDRPKAVLIHGSPGVRKRPGMGIGLGPGSGSGGGLGQSGSGVALARGLGFGLGTEPVFRIAVGRQPRKLVKLLFIVEGQPCGEIADRAAGRWWWSRARKTRRR